MTRAAELSAAFDSWIAVPENRQYFESDLFNQRCVAFDEFIEAGGVITIAGASQFLSLPLDITIHIMTKAMAVAKVAEAAMARPEGMPVH